MKYERLTAKKLRDTDIFRVLDENGNVVVDKRLFERFIEQHNRLAELEDKIEQGTLKEIPENEVVLTREEKQEYESLVKLLIYDKPIKSRVYEFIKDVKDKARKETSKKIDDYLVKRINENSEKLKNEQELPVIREAILKGMLYVRNAEREICKEIVEGKNGLSKL